MTAPATVAATLVPSLPLRLSVQPVPVPGSPHSLAAHRQEAVDHHRPPRHHPKDSRAQQVAIVSEAQTRDQLLRLLLVVPVVDEIRRSFLPVASVPSVLAPALWMVSWLSVTLMTRENGSGKQWLWIVVDGTQHLDQDQR